MLGMLMWCLYILFNCIIGWFSSSDLVNISEQKHLRNCLWVSSQSLMTWQIYKIQDIWSDPSHVSPRVFKVVPLYFMLYNVGKGLGDVRIEDGCYSYINIKHRRYTVDWTLEWMDIGQQPTHQSRLYNCTVLLYSCIFHHFILYKQNIWFD